MVSPPNGGGAGAVVSAVDRQSQGLENVRRYAGTPRSCRSDAGSLSRNQAVVHGRFELGAHRTAQDQASLVYRPSSRSEWCTGLAAIVKRDAPHLVCRHGRERRRDPLAGATRATISRGSPRTKNSSRAHVNSARVSLIWRRRWISTGRSTISNRFALSASVGCHWRTTLGVPSNEFSLPPSSSSCPETSRPARRPNSSAPPTRHR